MPSGSSAKPGRQQQRRERTRAALLTAGQELAASIGPESVTVAAVAELADVGFGTFYGHFATKDELLRELFAQDMAAQAQLIHERTDSLEDVAERVAIAVVMTIEWFASRHPWRLFVVRSGLYEGAMTEAFAAAVAEGTAGGRFAPASPQSLPQIFAGAVLTASSDESRSREQHASVTANLLVALGLPSQEALAIAASSAAAASS